METPILERAQITCGGNRSHHFQFALNSASDGVLWTFCDGCGAQLKFDRALNPSITPAELINSVEGH